MARKRSNKRKLDRRRRNQARFDGSVDFARRFGPYLLVGMIALGLPYGIFQAYLRIVSSTAWNVDTIEVKGNKWVPKSKLIHHAQITRGMNVFDVSLEQSARRLEHYDWIKSAQVERVLPDTLIIHVEEHQPAAVLVDEKGFFLVNSHGVPFKAINEDDPLNELVGSFHLITGSSRARLSKQTTNGQSERDRLKHAFRALQAYYKFKLHETAKLSEIHLDPVVGVSLVLEENGVEVRLGWGKYTERMKRFAKVYESLVEKDIQVDYILIDQDKDLSRVAVGLAPSKDRNTAKTP